MFKEELVNEIVDTTIDSIDECMGDYMVRIQPELIGKGQKVYNALLVKVIEELNKRIEQSEKQQYICPLILSQ